MGDKNSNAAAIDEVKDLKRKKGETDEDFAARVERAKEVDAAIAKAKEINSKRTGKGTRLAVGLTRGKGSQIISYEEFDEALPDTHPTSFQEFADLTKVATEPDIVKYAVLGFNSEAYKTASDPIAEFVNPAWPDEVQAQFRIVVRNYAKATSTSIEETVAIMKPGIEAAYQKTKQG